MMDWSGTIAFCRTVENYALNWALTSERQRALLHAALERIHCVFSNEFKMADKASDWLAYYSESVVLPILVSVVAKRKLRAVRPTPELFFKAAHLLMDNIDSPPTISALAHELGVSPRYLQIMFKSTLGISPKQFLNISRLNLARKRLTSGYRHGLVSDVANQLGFWHMGNFGQDFKKMFGMTPSDFARKNKEFDYEFDLDLEV